MYLVPFSSAWHRAGSGEGSRSKDSGIATASSSSTNINSKQVDSQKDIHKSTPLAAVHRPNSDNTQRRTRFKTKHLNKDLSTSDSELNKSDKQSKEIQDGGSINTCPGDSDWRRRKQTAHARSDSDGRLAPPTSSSSQG